MMNKINPRTLYFLTLIIIACANPATGQQINRITVSGINKTIKVTRDKWGINHITAANGQDLFFAQGYCAAKDRLFQFEIWRRQATGTLSEILGSREIKRDIGVRLFRYRGDMEKELLHYHPQGKTIISAFTAGINAYIDEMLKQPSHLPIEFKLLNILPGKWSEADVISRHQGILRNVTEELNTGRAVAVAGEDRVRKMMRYYPKEPILQMDTAVDAALLSAPILALYDAFKKDVIFLPEDIIAQYRNATALHAMNAKIKLTGEDQAYTPSSEGSNNWVISGKRSASGYPLLADDPHRKIALPSLRYIVHLSAPGWNVIGAGEPTIPGVSIGHNEYGAWGITVFDTDDEDLYVYDLNPQDLSEYRYRGEWKKMKSIADTVLIKGEVPMPVYLRYTLHGPVTYIDSVNNKAYAVKAGWLEAGSAPYLSALRIDQADSWEHFRDACSYSNIPALNMVWADKKGNIGWQVVGQVPIRKNFSGMVPVPGDGRYEWNGYLPVKERPHLFNPSKGFIATANQQLAPDNYTHWDAMGYTWPDAFRGNRLNDLLSKDSSVTLDKIKAMQTDYYSVPAQALVPMLQNIEMVSPLAKAAKEKLTQWNFVLDKNSVAAGIYFSWEQQLRQRASAVLLDSPLNKLLYIQLDRIISLLNAPDEGSYHLFGQDPQAGKNMFLQKSFEESVVLLAAKLGNDINKWQLGQDKYRHIQFIHPLAALVGDSLQRKLNTTSLPRSGNSYTIGNTSNADNQNNGASFRIIADTKDWDKTLMTNAPGQSADPGSPFYKNLFEIWGRDQYFPAYYSAKKIMQAAVSVTLLQPSGGAR